MVIISRDVSQRLKEKSKLQKQQKSQMDLSNIDKTNNNYRSFQSSKDDDYMKSALQKVRNNKSTIDTNYARFTGTSLFNDPTFHKLNNSGLNIVKSNDLDKLYLACSSSGLIRKQFLYESIASCNFCCCKKLLPKL